MVQTQKQALSAYAALQRMGRKATGKAAFTLFRMKQKLKEIVEFQAEEERKLVEKHDGKISEEGMILIADAEERKAFGEEQKELYDMEIEPAIEPVTVKLDGLPEINMEEIEALDGFVQFE